MLARTPSTDKVLVVFFLTNRYPAAVGGVYVSLRGVLLTREELSTGGYQFPLFTPSIHITSNL